MKVAAAGFVNDQRSIESKIVHGTKYRKIVWLCILDINV